MSSATSPTTPPTARAKTTPSDFVAHSAQVTVTGR
jgi:hypothetical protein